MSAHRLVSDDAVQQAERLGHSIVRSSAGTARVICNHCHQLGDERSKLGIVFTRQCANTPNQG